MKTVCDAIYHKFQIRLNRTSRVVTDYILSEDEYDEQIEQLAKVIKYIYDNNNDCFQYIFEKIYSHNKTPFVSAYRHFTENKLSFIDLAYFILKRYNKEQKTKNNYICF